MKTYIGIDIHKRTQTWVALGEGKHNTLFTRTFDVTPQAVTEAITFTQALCGKELVAAIEPVCGWLWVVAMLRKEGIEVHISNPRKTRAISDSLQKTDENDAYMLALLCRSGLMYESHEVSQSIQKLRSLIRERSFLIRVRASMKCRLESIVTRSGRHLLEGSLRSKKGATAILASNEGEWKRALYAIRDIDTYITELDEYIAQYSKEPVPQLLMTVPGVGKVTAVSIWAEVGVFERFSSAQKLCAYAGLVPGERSSGGIQKMGHITKTGSKVLRYVLVEAAMHVRNTDNSAMLYDFYVRIKERRGAMRARVALAHKILTIMWHMLHTNTAYQQRSTV
jgi:transposase